MEDTDDDEASGEKDAEEIAGEITEEDVRCKRKQRDAEKDENTERDIEDAEIEKASIRGSGAQNDNNPGHGDHSIPTTIRIPFLVLLEGRSLQNLKEHICWDVAGFDLRLNLKYHPCQTVADSQ
ncbi:hypothetical protein NDU88_003204 [Pleurodeles waltl]|uniref:Uncharacterized protein n=1 Tax=Pleurodeles waltl TaxID=8319 RepID=A0AAV7UXT1_PLEWA|nr:hypothetical protein NDU88_003204 [Pleurodeles waltl]